MSGGFPLNFKVLGITAINLTDLEADITADEVRAAIKELPADRAPGPDGYTGEFYKTAWSIIKDDVLEAIQAFS